MFNELKGMGESFGSRWAALINTRVEGRGKSLPRVPREFSRTTIIRSTFRANEYKLHFYKSKTVGIFVSFLQREDEKMRAIFIQFFFAPLVEIESSENFGYLNKLSN